MRGLNEQIKNYFFVNFAGITVEHRNLVLEMAQRPENYPTDEIKIQLCANMAHCNVAAITPDMLEAFKKHLASIAALSADTTEEEVIIDIPEWPAPPDPEAFDGLAGEFVSMWEPHTEADRAALLIQFLIFFGHAVGHAPHFVISGDYHRCNEYGLLVGPTSRARKGQSFNCVKNTFKQVADPQFIPFDGDTNTALPPAELLPILHTASGLQSGEGLIHIIRDAIWSTDKKGVLFLSDSGVADKRLLLNESEYAAVLRRMGRDANSLSEMLRDGWDNKDYLQNMTKNSPEKVTDPYISMIGHVTPIDLRKYLNDVDAGNGFANRHLFIASKRIKLMSNPGSPNKKVLAAFTQRLAVAIAQARKVQQMYRSLEAEKLWTDMYKSLEAPRPGRLHGSVCTRASAHVVRLSMIYALLDTPTVADLSGEPKNEAGAQPHNPSGLLTRKPNIITAKHLKSAYELWMYSERSSKMVFGNLLGDKTAEKILELLLEAGASGLLTGEIRQKVSDKKGVPGALGLLLEQELVVPVKFKVGATKSSDAQRWFHHSVNKSN